MNEKLFTLPLDPQWRETIKEDPRWRKGFKTAVEKRSPWLVNPMVNILANETTEMVLTRLVRASKDGLPAAYFRDVLSGCWYYAIRTGYKKNQTVIPWMVNRKGLQRMAETTRDTKIKLSKMLAALMRSGPLESDTRESRMISIFVDADKKKNVRFTDKDILDSLDAVADFWESMAKPRTSHRPEQWDLHFLLAQMEYKFRERFSKPLYSVIAQLVQVAVDVRQMTNGETKPDKWTDDRVIKMLQRHHQTLGYHKIPSLASLVRRHKIRS